MREAHPKRNPVFHTYFHTSSSSYSLRPPSQFCPPFLLLSHKMTSSKKQCCHTCACTDSPKFRRVCDGDSVQKKTVCNACYFASRRLSRADKELTRTLKRVRGADDLTKAREILLESRVCLSNSRLRKNHYQTMQRRLRTQ